MSHQAQIAFQEMANKQALANGGISGQAAFAVAPAVNQKLHTEVQQKSDLLSRINFKIVNATSGKKILFGSDKTGSGRGARAARDLANNRAKTYSTLSRTFDTQLAWADIDAWMHEGDLKGLYRAFYTEQQARETAAIALRGIAQDADPQTNFAGDEEAILQNVDLGWPAIMKQTEPNGGFPSNVFEEWELNSGCIIAGDQRILPLEGIAVVDNGGGLVSIPFPNHGLVIGNHLVPGATGAKFVLSGSANYNGIHSLDATSDAHNLVFAKAFLAETLPANTTATQDPDFANLDELITEGADLIEDRFMDKFNIQAILSRQVVSGEKVKLHAAQNDATPSEKQHVAACLNSFGGLKADRVLGMTANSAWITAFENLSIYEAKETRRRELKDDHDAQAWTQKDYAEMTNVVEEVKAMVVLENIFFLKKHSSQP